LIPVDQPGLLGDWGKLSQHGHMTKKNNKTSLLGVSCVISIGL